MTAYMIFRGKIYADLKAELESNGSAATMQEMNKAVAQRWQVMTDEEKKPVSTPPDGNCSQD